MLRRLNRGYEARQSIYGVEISIVGPPISPPKIAQLGIVIVLAGWINRGLQMLIEFGKTASQCPLGGKLSYIDNSPVSVMPCNILSSRERAQIIRSFIKT